MWREQLHCNLNTTCQMKTEPLHSVVSYPRPQEGLGIPLLQTFMLESQAVELYKKISSI